MEKDFKLSIDRIVLIDTCTFINLEKAHPTKATLSAFKTVIDLDCLICISDLSMIELILGCTKEEELLKHFNNLTDMEFTIFGRFDELKNHLEPKNISRVIKKKELDKFKEEIKTIRNVVLFPAFQNIFLAYCQQLLMMLQIDDSQYWDGAFFLINGLFAHKKEEINRLLDETMCECLDRKKESKLLLSDSFKSILISLLPQLDGAKYNETEITTRLSNLNSKKLFLKLFDSLHLKKDASYEDFCYIKPMMKRFKLNAHYSNLEEEITKDGINYVTMYILSKHANFDSHDLIDLLNISMAGYENIDVNYYTDEDKWVKFAKIEQAICPRCPHIDILQLEK